MGLFDGIKIRKAIMHQQKGDLAQARAAYEELYSQGVNLCAYMLPWAVMLLREGGEVACLIKPQFEAGREKVGKKGVVRDPAVHLEVLENFLRHAKENNFTVLGITYSPIRGPEGNIEYLGYLKKGGEADCVPDLRALVDASHSALKEGHGEI